jgi:hypothetical protein
MTVSDPGQKYPSIPLEFPGSIGRVTLEAWRTTRPFLAINGKPVRRGLHSAFRIPMNDGTKTKAAIRGRLPGSVRVVSQGRVVFETPQTPMIHMIVTALPILLMFISTGPVGFFGAFALVAINMKILTSDRISSRWKILLPLGVFLLGGLAVVALAVVLSPFFPTILLFGLVK